MERYVKFIGAFLVQFLEFLDFILIAFMIGHLLIQFLLKIILTLAAMEKRIYQDFGGKIDVIPALCNVHLI
jgi:hypothetical protein